MRRAGKRWFALLTVREKILYSLEGMGIAAIAGFLCFRSIWTLTALPPAAVVFLFYQERQKKERMLLARQIEFKNLLADLYSTTAAGGTLEKALRDAVKEMKRSGGRYPVLMPQMERVILEMDRNVPAEAALERFAEASEDPEIRHFVQVLKVAARSGGSLPDIIGRTAEMAAVRMEMNAEIETLLAGRKAELKVMLAVPAGILLYMNLGSPEYMEVLYKSLTGRMIMSAGLVLYIAAFMIGRKILSIRV